MSKAFTKTIALFLIAIFPIYALSQSKEKKPKVIAMTDGEIDDKTSMVRFLLYTCDVDLQAIIQNNSVYQRGGHSKEHWLEKHIDAYEQVYPNLIKHNPDYPTADEIRKKCFVGDEDSNHIIKITSPAKWIEQKPGTAIEYMPDTWANTPGSDRIVEVLLDKDSDHVYIQAWGGGNTAAKAFYKLKTEYPNDYDRAISKVVMYNIWYQDDAGNYIETYHPKVTMLYCNSFNTTWAYRIQTDTKDFVTNQVKNHGPLGGLYPQDYISEGDTPSFLYTLNTGLRSYENPTYGGWGGRFVRLPGFKNVYTDATDDGDVKKPLARWINDVNNDFASKLNWCIAPKFSDANHKPLINLKTKSDITVKPGEKIFLNANGTKDPDGNTVTYKWWQYKEAGTYQGTINIENASADKTSFTIPRDTNHGTIHIILEVSDNGTPPLVSYKRIIVTVSP
ncbi:MAG: nucleoside hydrolase-like domain-containing protein [Ginsengibacter sp.]